MRIKEKINDFFVAYPMRIYYAMVTLIAIGIIVAIVRYVTYEPPEAEIKFGVESGIEPLSKGIGGIIDVTTAMKRIKELEKDLEVVLSKDTFSQADSIKIVTIYDEIESIINYINEFE
ncbi:MAG: hypothetical protein Q4G63_04370 [Bacteroidia bacterium]|nr:hypothetical protein [Bacteroidia bacterium]